MFGRYHEKNATDKSPHLCEPLSNAYRFLIKEDKYSKHSPYTKLLNQLRSCQGSGATPFVLSVFKRLTSSGDVLIDEVFRLRILQSVVDTLAVGYVDVKMSKQLINNPIFIEIGRDIFYPEVTRLFANLQSAGLFQKFRDVTQLTRFLEFWQNFKTRKNTSWTNDEQEVIELGTIEGGSGAKGPVILQMSHVRTLLVLYVILSFVGIVRFCWEARKRHK